MSKWLIWTLLELNTFFFLASLVFLWLSYSLKKKIKSALEENPQKNPIELSEKDKEVISYKRLASFLDKQINFAAKIIRPESNNHHETNTIKLWGTILRAERAIILNQASETPTPILTRFLSTLLYALFSQKLQMANTNELNQSLKAMETELFQTAELLIVKESLTKNQLSLNEDLRNNIDRANRRLAQLRSKQKEKQRLELEINELQKKIKNLEENQIKLTINLPDVQSLNKNDRKTSFKQVDSLNHLSDRQRIVIDQLKNEMKKASSNQSSYDLVESQKIAIAKMERISQESQTLITQLETELETSNLTIASLKNDINVKDEKLAVIEKRLSSSNETAIGNLQTLNVNKKETLTSLRNDLSSALESRSSESLIKQEKDTQMLERLLQESETCVTLLVQELETAEEVNQKLKQKVDALLVNNNDSSDSSHFQILQQRERNRDLVKVTTELKRKMLNMTSDKDCA